MKTVAVHLAITLSVSILIFAYNHIGIVGILKSGGDSAFCCIADAAGVWLVSLSLILAAAIPLYASTEIVYGLSLVEIIIKSFFVRRRIFDEKWARNLMDAAKI
ncbi:MAG: hypothetical protein LBL35_00600 [Clostridiales bacterium]|nr:hypothetical protein [Clostridiales bacterium]